MKMDESRSAMASMNVPMTLSQDCCYQNGNAVSYQPLEPIEDQHPNRYRPNDLFERSFLFES